MADAGLRRVHMFWHGAPLSRIERLSLASFVHHGHPLRLHVYDEPAGVPPGVELADAAHVLPAASLYRHHRSGSLAPFADWFRYRLLCTHGGIWADADVICVRPLDYAEPVIMAWENPQQLNNAVLGLPAGDPLAQSLADSCEQPNGFREWDSWSMRLRKLKRRLLYPGRRERAGWSENGPRGLTRAAGRLGYLRQALPHTHFYPVRCEDWRRMFAAPLDPQWPPWPEETRAVHLWNEMMRRASDFDKNAQFAAQSPFERLWREIVHDAR